MSLANCHGDPSADDSSSGPFEEYIRTERPDETAGGLFGLCRTTKKAYKLPLVRSVIRLRSVTAVFMFTLKQRFYNNNKDGLDIEYVFFFNRPC